MSATTDADAEKERMRKDRFAARMWRRQMISIGDVEAISYGLILRAKEYRRLMLCSVRRGDKFQATERRWAAVACYEVAWQLTSKLPKGARLLKRRDWRSAA